jgi:hypothetical protein
MLVEMDTARRLFPHLSDAQLLTLADPNAAEDEAVHAAFMAQRFPQIAAAMPGFQRLDSLGLGYPASTGPVPTGRASADVGRTPRTGSPWARVTKRDNPGPSTIVRNLLANSGPPPSIGY